jgi:hypothetical protein
LPPHTRRVVIVTVRLVQRFIWRGWVNPSCPFDRWILDSLCVQMGIPGAGAYAWGLRKFNWSPARIAQGRASPFYRKKIVCHAGTYVRSSSSFVQGTYKIRFPQLEEPHARSACDIAPPHTHEPVLRSANGWPISPGHAATCERMREKARKQALRLMRSIRPERLEAAFNGTTSLAVVLEEERKRRQRVWWEKQLHKRSITIRRVRPAT